MVKFEDVIPTLYFAPNKSNVSHPDHINTKDSLIKIQDFEQKYQFWIFDFADKLLIDCEHTSGAKSEHAGFAILLLTNAYLDMVAQIHGFNRQKRPHDSVESRYIKGLFLVFPYLEKVEQASKYAKHIYNVLRNSLAHMGLTGERIILSSSLDRAITTGTLHGEIAVAINPRIWLSDIKRHFESLIRELKTNEALQKEFLERISKPN